MDNFWLGTFLTALGVAEAEWGQIGTLFTHAVSPGGHTPHGRQEQGAVRCQTRPHEAPVYTGCLHIALKAQDTAVPCTARSSRSASGTSAADTLRKSLTRLSRITMLPYLCIYVTLYIHKKPCDLWQISLQIQKLYQTVPRWAKLGLCPGPEGCWFKSHSQHSNHNKTESLSKTLNPKDRGSPQAFRNYTSLSIKGFAE